MAGQVKISDLPSKTSAASTDYMVVDNGVTTSKIKKEDFLKDAVPQDYDTLKTQVETNKNNIGALQNNKQDSITDLADIRSGASKGATAVQDSNYVHTDNNYTNQEKSKLENLENYDDTQIKEDIRGVNEKVDNLISDDEVALDKSWSSKKVSDKLNDIELAKFPNVTIVGQPTIQQGQISNFSSTNYCQFPFVVDFQNQAFELDFEITTGADVTQQHNVFDSAFGLAFAVRQSKFVLAVSTNGTSWNIGEVLGSHTVLPNTTYRIRLVWDKQNLTLEYSTDGGTSYVLDSTRALTEQPYPKQMFIGVTSNVLDPQSSITIFNGIINLNYATLNIANKVVWQGMDDVGLATRMAVDMSNIDEAGVNKVKSIIDLDTRLESYETKANADKVHNELHQVNNRQDALIDNLNQVVDGELMLETIDSNPGDKTVISGTLDHAELNMLGGMSRKGKNLIILSDDKIWSSQRYSKSEQDDVMSFTSTGVYGRVGYKVDGLVVGKTYTISATCFGNNVTGSSQIIVLQSDGASFIDNPQYGFLMNQVISSEPTTFTKTFTATTSDLYFNIYITPSNTPSNTYGDTISLKNVQLEEGSTATPYEPYTDQLIDAKEDEVTSIGKNILKNVTSRTDNSGDTSRNWIRYNELIKVTPGETYTFSSDLNVNIFAISLKLFDSTGNYIKAKDYTYKNTSNIVIQLPDENYSYIQIGLYDENLKNYEPPEFPQLEKGSIATPYSPYKEQIKPIPQEVQNLDGYGIGINSDKFNYLEWKDGKILFHKKVGSVDLGSLNYIITGTRFQTNISDMATQSSWQAFLMASNDWEFNTSISLLNPAVTKKIYGIFGKGILFYDPNNKTSVSILKSSLNGVYLYYPLAEEVVTDVTDLFPADWEILNVEPNGTIEFHYPLKEIYPIDVPNKITYYTKNSLVEKINGLIDDNTISDDTTWSSSEIASRFDTAAVVVDISGSRGGKPTSNTINIYIGDTLQESKAYNGAPVTFRLQKGGVYRITATDSDPFFDCVPKTITVLADTSVVLQMTEIGDTTTWKGVNDIVDHQKGSDYFNAGDKFTSNTWTDTATGANYNHDLRVNGFQDFELEDGSIRQKAMILQHHWAHPFGVQFSHERAFLRCPNGLAAGTYYFTIETSWGSNVQAGDIVCFTLTEAVPAGGRIAGCYGAPDQAKSNWRIYVFDAYGVNQLQTITPTFTASGTNLGVQKHNSRNGDLNSTQEMAYGCNRWETSAIRQYLNSDKTKNNWWTAQDEWDIRPNELSTKDGFLCGMDPELLAQLKTVKVRTYKNTVTYDGSEDITYDRVFLPALEQMYINPQIAGEGEAQQYWKELNGTTTKWAQYGTYEILKHFAVENHTSAQSVRLRSAHRTNAYYAWYVYSVGNVNNSHAAYSFRFAPIVVI